MQEFSNIGIIGFADRRLIKPTIKRLIDFLFAQGLSLYIEERIAGCSETDGITSCSRAEIGQNCDLIIVVGGDGSLLHAARDLVQFDIPMLGVNRGRLGFLTDILPENLESEVANVLSGNYARTERFMLEAEVLREGSTVDRGIALNDVVLQPSASIRMIEFGLKIDDQFVYRQRSDGLIVSTPTGSTAYALSGGGSIVHPGLHAINVVPINPHTLSSRPILVDADARLEVDVLKGGPVEAMVVCDGQNYLDVELGDLIRVKRMDKRLCLLHPEEHDFYATCRSKLNWASHKASDNL